MTLVYGLLVGVVMGVLIQRVRASSPAVIKSNLRLEDLSVIKFMALAIAVGAVAAYVLALVVPMHFAIKPLHVLGVGLGGLIFGVGFALAGYCPGTCLVGAAEGRRDAFITLAGGLAGALVFTLAYPYLDGLLSVGDLGALTLVDLVRLPGVAVALMLAGALVLVVAVLPTRRAASVPATGPADSAAGAAHPGENT